MSHLHPLSILLVEDTSSLRAIYEAMLRAAGHEPIPAATAEEGLRLFRSRSPALVLLDLMLPDRDGLDLLVEMLALRPSAQVIVVTANGSVNKAVAAMRGGAIDFLVKPFDEQRLLAAVENARMALPDPGEPAAPGTAPAGEFIGSSETMRQVYGLIRSVAPSMATVFITGESGTGKELCAQAIHENSRRAAGPFIALNCGAIPSDLLESEVFGHLRGSFTGAVADKIGAAAAADGGTLFLDEICEMDANLQTKLLRFLQTSTIQPVGAVKSRKVNVRIVCATNRDPLEQVRRGNFREDLYYRLHVVPLHMPPLRERAEDVVEIAEVALRRMAREEGRRFERLDEEVRQIFRAAPWPGNVRQLLNVIRNVVVLHDQVVVTAAMLPREILRPAEEPVRLDARPAPAGRLELDGLIGRTLAEVEQMVIEETIARHGGSVPKAARVLDVSPSTLYRKLESWQKNRDAV